MGFDLYGLKPTRSQGDYFRRSIHSWPELWANVEKYCGDILTDRDHMFAHSNDGHCISENKAKRIASRLQHNDCELEFAEFCYFSGGFSID